FDFPPTQNIIEPEYDDKLVRKIIQNVKVYEDHFVIAFKPGIEMEI
ncbi:TPA: type IV secretory system conjugative DNA transfer family protein, partial [Enterococcus faecium]|nr:type IV secretory system conjugative DNA transfer family protein [Enterococcus faecium]HAP8051852.1 type IV secretory system conjugative DNA transfer family protein [Enterococcus faecium]HAP8111354.1 type IV secretory system conjugative DNA transfer family protein [Enterococcus faecium]HAP8117115.1 type IV secretory system conjugative DNA transfer family protein [Enterococcus faecium]HBC2437237.1 type IV secretory system conjugative DNA transfer family protein [Enterococcus faecium]